MDSVLSILSSVLSICCSRSSSEDGFNSLEAQAHQSSSSTSYSSSSTSYSSSSTTDGWSYDVFLSFRGEDTRKNFTDHLYTALERAGVKTFRDDKLKRGEPIAPSLLKAIENSRISIAVFSRNYASSKWCLEELAKMVECRDRNGQTLFPIFFDVDPSEVRNQTGSFAKAFCQHEKCFEKEKVEKWRGALREVGQLSGWSLKDVANGDTESHPRAQRCHCKRGSPNLLNSSFCKSREDRQPKTQRCHCASLSPCVNSYGREIFTR